MKSSYICVIEESRFLSIAFYFKGVEFRDARQLNQKLYNYSKIGYF